MTQLRRPVRVMVLTTDPVQLKRCLQGLSRTIVPLTVDILSQGVGPLSDSVAYLSQRNIRATVIERSQNVGVAEGRRILCDIQQDVRRDDLLVFLDDDVSILSPFWLDKAIEVLKRPDVGICGPSSSFVLPDWSGFIGGYVGEVDVVTGYCQIWKGEVWQAGCRPDVVYSPFWHEDSDFCLQIRALGWRVWCVALPVAHTPRNSGDMPGLSQRNMGILRARWQGRRLIHAERVMSNGS